MSGRGDEPPDWVLPGWDAVDDTDAAPRAPAGTRPVSGAGPTAAPGQFGVRILGVSEVTRAVRGAVRQDPRLTDLWVEGEIGRVTISSAGHAYFALKDERNQLQCVWFRDDRQRSAFEAQAGLRVVAHGRIDLYEPSGALQLYVDSLQPSGLGDLTLRFEALKARLAAEGLFDAARKRPLPPRPTTIAVVTSPTGAVWRDICHVLARRWPMVRVLLVAAKVQGDDAPASLVTAMRRVERYIDESTAAGRPGDAPALTILARGGGSLEDLWAFNDERVVRAVVGHRVPVVAGIGHEVDVTLADFAADVRAPTPSAAAELVVPDMVESSLAIAGLGRRLDGSVTRRVAAAGREVAGERRVLERLHPAARLAASRERTGLLLDRATATIRRRVEDRRRTLETAESRFVPTLPGRLIRERQRVARTDVLPALATRRLERARTSLTVAAVLPGLATRRLDRARTGLTAAVAALDVLGPQATLDRGYAIVRRADDGAIVRDPEAAPGGTALRLRVARGELPATADDR